MMTINVLLVTIIVPIYRHMRIFQRYVETTLALDFEENPG